MQSSNDLLTARQTAERLGIKLDTLYAYVSRGLLRSVSLPGGRERGYRAEEVERLRAGRGASRATRGEPLVPVIDSSICLIEDGRLYYRGRDAIRLAETATLEEAADLLWDGGGLFAPHPGPLPASGERERRRAAFFTLAPPAGRGRGPRRQAREGEGLPGLIERGQVRLATLAAADLAALDLTAAGIV